MKNSASISNIIGMNDEEIKEMNEIYSGDLIVLERKE